jgi:predicted metal-dependent peptidase
MLSDSRLRLTHFRTACQKAVPYMAHTVYGMPAHERPGIGTMAVDKYGRLYFDPAFVASISVETGRFAILHETLHIVLNHCGLAEKHLGDSPTQRQRFLWNVAADAVVNGILANWLADAPEGIVTAEGYDLPPKKTVVEYYQILLDRDREDEDNGPSLSRPDDLDEQCSLPGDDDDSDDVEQPGADSEDGGQPGDDSDGDSQPGEGSEGGEQPGDDGQEQDRGDTGGSGADGVPRDYELPPDPAWKDREYAAAVELEEAIREAEESKPGSVPGELTAAVNMRLRPQPDPWDLLTGAVAKAVASPLGAPQYTLRRLSRRQQEGQPRLRGISKETPSVVVILDTSGSMQIVGENSDRAQRALDVIAKGLRRLGRVRCVCFDGRLHDRQTVQSMRSFQVTGGGGTDMAAAIEQIDREDRPDAILLVSDCETGWPRRKPRARVVVADVGGLWHPRIPAWARAINLAKAETGGVR